MRRVMVVQQRRQLSSRLAVAVAALAAVTLLLAAGCAADPGATLALDAAEPTSNRLAGCDQPQEQQHGNDVAPSVSDNAVPSPKPPPTPEPASEPELAPPTNEAADSSPGDTGGTDTHETSDCNTLCGDQEHPASSITQRANDLLVGRRKHALEVQQHDPLTEIQHTSDHPEAPQAEQGTSALDTAVDHQDAAHASPSHAQLENSAQTGDWTHSDSSCSFASDAVLTQNREANARTLIEEEGGGIGLPFQVGVWTLGAAFILLQLIISFLLCPSQTTHLFLVFLGPFFDWVTAEHGSGDAKHDLGPRLDTRPARSILKTARRTADVNRHVVEDILKQVSAVYEAADREQDSADTAAHAAPATGHQHHSHDHNHGSRHRRRRHRRASKQKRRRRRSGAALADASGTGDDGSSGDVSASAVSRRDSLSSSSNADADDSIRHCVRTMTNDGGSESDSMAQSLPQHASADPTTSTDAATTTSPTSIATVDAANSAVPSVTVSSAATDTARDGTGADNAGANVVKPQRVGVPISDADDDHDHEAENNANDTARDGGDRREQGGSHQTVGCAVASVDGGAVRQNDHGDDGGDDGRSDYDGDDSREVRHESDDSIAADSGDNSTTTSSLHDSERMGGDSSEVQVQDARARGRQPRRSMTPETVHDTPAARSRHRPPGRRHTRTRAGKAKKGDTGGDEDGSYGTSGGSDDGPVPIAVQLQAIQRAAELWADLMAQHEGLADGSGSSGSSAIPVGITLGDDDDMWGHSWAGDGGEHRHRRNSWLHLDSERIAQQRTLVQAPRTGGRWSTVAFTTKPPDVFETYAAWEYDRRSVPVTYSFLADEEELSGTGTASGASPRGRISAASIASQRQGSPHASVYRLEAIPEEEEGTLRLHQQHQQQGFKGDSRAEVQDSAGGGGGGGGDDQSAGLGTARQGVTVAAGVCIGVDEVEKANEAPLQQKQIATQAKGTSTHANSTSPSATAPPSSSASSLEPTSCQPAATVSQAKAMDTTSAPMHPGADTQQAPIINMTQADGSVDDDDDSSSSSSRTTTEAAVKGKRNAVHGEQAGVTNNNSRDHARHRHQRDHEEGDGEQTNHTVTAATTAAIVANNTTSNTSNTTSTSTSHAQLEGSDDHDDHHHHHRRRGRRSHHEHRRRRDRHSHDSAHGDSSAHAVADKSDGRRTRMPGLVTTSSIAEDAHMSVLPFVTAHDVDDDDAASSLDGSIFSLHDVFGDDASFDERHHSQQQAERGRRGSGGGSAHRRDDNPPRAALTERSRTDSSPHSSSSSSPSVSGSSSSPSQPPTPDARARHAPSLPPGTKTTRAATSSTRTLRNAPPSPTSTRAISATRRALLRRQPSVDLESWELKTEDTTRRTRLTRGRSPRVSTSLSPPLSPVLPRAPFAPSPRSGSVSPSISPDPTAERRALLTSPQAGGLGGHDDSGGGSSNEGDVGAADEWSDDDRIGSGADDTADTALGQLRKRLSSLEVFTTAADQQTQDRIIHRWEQLQREKRRRRAAIQASRQATLARVEKERKEQQKENRQQALERALRCRSLSTRSSTSENGATAASLLPPRPSTAMGAGDARARRPHRQRNASEDGLGATSPPRHAALGRRSASLSWADCAIPRSRTSTHAAVELSPPSAPASPLTSRHATHKATAQVTGTPSPGKRAQLQAGNALVAGATPVATSLSPHPTAQPSGRARSSSLPSVALTITDDDSE